MIIKLVQSHLRLSELLQSSTNVMLSMQANTKLSVANFEEAMRVPKALGLDPAAANLLASASSTAHRMFPGRPPARQDDACMK